MICCGTRMGGWGSAPAAAEDAAQGPWRTGGRILSSCGRWMNPFGKHGHVTVREALVGGPSAEGVLLAVVAVAGSCSG